MADSVGSAVQRQRSPTGTARIVVTVAALLLVAGCAAPPPKPTELVGSVQASANVNPSVSKRPSPLLLRVYELKSSTAFGNADFVSLYQRDQAELGAEMVGRQEFSLNPGDTQVLAKIAAPETRFLGVVAAFRDVEHAVWRAVVPVVPNQKQRIVISADGLAVTVTVAVVPAK
jgi:type VI secretion system protein VasD